MDVAKPVLDSLYKSVSEGILVFDKKGSILYTNYTADVIFGFLDETSEKRRIMECIGNDPVNDACKDAIIDVLYSETGKVTRKVTYQNGNRRYVLLMNSQYVNEEEFQGFIVVFTDVSKLETLEETERALQQYTVKNRELTSQNEILSGAFRRHLDDDVVEELLNAPSGIDTHTSQKEMSLLMLMNPGLQRQISGMSAEDYLAMINHYYDRAISIIKENNGTIFELHNDSILAGFGALREAEHCTDDAVHAADGIQRAIPELNAWNEERGYPLQRVKIGVHTDEFTIGVIGGGGILKYNVFGKNINFTARIAISAEYGDVVVSESAWNRLEGDYELRSQYEIVPKGMAEPVKVYRVKRK